MTATIAIIDFGGATRQPPLSLDMAVAAVALRKTPKSLLPNSIPKFTAENLDAMTAFTPLGVARCTKSDGTFELGLADLGLRAISQVNNLCYL